ncbi:DDE superfamily endonuclease [Pyrenophora tritici-repentis]|nr:DDE superfamily endonuclease [Pyrenophora tritici-repentis]
MLPHSSYLLQPLDVGCFSPLKRAYSREVESLMRNHINHITKLEFLPAFKIAFNRAFTPANICSAFRGAGLVPLQLEAVLSKVDVQLRTPTPPAALPEAPWVAQTPSNVRELEAQSSLIRERVRQHKSSSPALIIIAID